MKLPQREQAFIPPEKIYDYLLSETHPVGKTKAKFLRAVGFDSTNANALMQALLAIAQNTEVHEIQTTPHGVKYVLDGAVATPKGYEVLLRTIWIISANESQPRFVTAYPI